MKQRFERAHMLVHTYVRYVWASQPLKVLMILMPPPSLLLLLLLQTVNSAKSHYKRNGNENRMHALNADNNKLCAISLPLCHVVLSMCVCFLSIMHSKMSIRVILCVNRMCGVLSMQNCSCFVVTAMLNVWMSVCSVHVSSLVFFIIFWFTFMCLNLNFKSLNC